MKTALLNRVESLHQTIRILNARVASKVGNKATYAMALIAREESYKTLNRIAWILARRYNVMVEVFVGK